MATIQHKSADKTVATISERNALLPRRPHMTVLVMDAIGDPYAGSGKAVYRWIEETQSWYLIAKDNVETLSLAEEMKTIIDGKVQASYIPANGIIWDAYIEDSNNVIHQVHYTVEGPTITILPDTKGQFNGKSFRFKYAYGSLAQQVEYALTFKADLHHQHTTDDIAGLTQALNRPEYHSVSMPGPLGVTTGKLRWYMPYAATLSSVLASVSTPSVGGPVKASVRKNNVVAATVTINEGSNTSKSSTNVTLAAGDYLTVDVTSVGSTVAGSDMVLTLVFNLI